MLAGTLVYVNAGTQLAQHRFAARHPVAGADRLAGAARRVPAGRAEDRRVRAARARSMRAGARPAEALRPQPGRHRRRRGGARDELHRRGRQGQGDARRKRHKMGGDCLNYGCVPSKALIRRASPGAQMRTRPSYGLAKAEATIDFAAVMERVRASSATIEPHDSVERYTGLGVDVCSGQREIVDPWTVEIDARRRQHGDADDARDRDRHRRRTVRAAAPRAGRDRLPDQRHVVGAARTAAAPGRARRRADRLRAGAGVCAARRAGDADRDGAAPADARGRRGRGAGAAALGRDGVRVLAGHKALRCEQEGAARRRSIVEARRRASVRIEFDQLLCAVGRVARLEGYGLEELGIAGAAHDRQTNDYLETIYPEHLRGRRRRRAVPVHAHRVAPGLVCGGQRAVRRVQEVQGRLLGDPVGDLHRSRGRARRAERAEAKEQGVAYEVTRYGLDDLDRAIADGAAEGFVKVLTAPGKDKILGVTIVGAHAADLLAEYVLAMKHGLGLNKILGTIHIYPTWPRPTSTRQANGSARTSPSGCCAGWRAFTRGGAAPRGEAAP